MTKTTSDILDDICQGQVDTDVETRIMLMAALSDACKRLNGILNARLEQTMHYDGLLPYGVSYAFLNGEVSVMELLDGDYLTIDEYALDNDNKPISPKIHVPPALVWPRAFKRQSGGPQGMNSDADTGIVGNPVDGPIWSVIGVYTDDDQEPVIFHVYAPDPYLALGVIDMEKMRSWNDPDCWLDSSYESTLVFKGAITDARWEAV